MIAEEVWAPAAGFPAYEVSNQGRVRSLPRKVRSKGLAMCPVHGGLLTPRVTANGYCRVKLSTSSRRYHLVHRLVAESFLGKPPSRKHQVNHKNGVRSDNRVANLEWVTASENCLHAFAVLSRRPSGKPHPGESNGRAKLTVEDALEILRVFALGGITKVALGRRYGVSGSAISSLVRGKAWRCLAETRARDAQRQHVTPTCAAGFTDALRGIAAAVRPEIARSYDEEAAE